MPFTLSDFCEYREEIRKSRFITFAAPIGSPADAQAFIAQHSDPNATHTAGRGSSVINTAAPMTASPAARLVDRFWRPSRHRIAIRSSVLVIRWYGGTQLGTGGLARAYGGGANKCLQAAPKVELISRVPVRCACAFS